MRMRIGFTSTLLFFLVCSAQAGQEPVVASGAATKKIDAKNPLLNLPAEKANPMRVPRFDKPPVIDGKLDDEVWNKAALFKDFYQIHPGDNVAPSQQTEVRLGYDSKTFYLAFRAYDVADKVRATVPKRDEIFNDDHVQVILDTFNDKRKSYELSFNPLGVQADAVFTDGVNSDSSVDIVMESKGRVGEDGYVVEVAIPFKSLRYVAGKDKLWGINFYRRIQRNDSETDSWMPISRDKVALLSQFGHISGLEGIDSDRTLEIIPSITLSESARRVPTLSAVAIAGDPTLREPGRLVNSPIVNDLGVTVKFGLSSTITLDFAANPDFAQVEADQPVVTANQRFPIFFSEKRPFFLEGIDIFQTPIQAVHTRAIVDPDYAVKLTGKQGRNSFGILLASDNAPGNFSEEERADPNILPGIEKFLDKNAYVGVLRYKRDVGKESNLGALVTSYDFIDNHNRVFGIDGRLRLDKQTTFSFQALASHSRTFFRNIELEESENRTGVGAAYSWNWNRSTRHTNINLNGNGTSRDYRSEVGFTYRTDTYSNSAYFNYHSEPKAKARLISWGISQGGFFSYNGKGRSQDLGYNGNLNLSFTRQTYVGIGWNTFHNRLFEEEFGARRTATRSGAFFGDAERSLSGSALYSFWETTPSKTYSFGGFFGHQINVFDYDFGAGPRYPRASPAALADPNAPLDPGAADSWDLNLYFSYKPVAALESSLRYNRNTLIRKDTERTLFVSNIYSWYTKYQFTRFTFVRARLDYSTLDSHVGGQYLFGWTPNPGTAFYLGYNDTFQYNGYNSFTGHYEPGFRLQGRTFFIKMSYLFRRSL